MSDFDPKRTLAARVNLQILTALSLPKGDEPKGGLIISPDAFTVANRNLIISLAAHYRLPAIYPYRFYAADGGLMSYGHDINEPWQRAPAYVDKILKGTSPADLPIQQPTKFELIINLKTAKALGLTIPTRARPCRRVD